MKKKTLGKRLSVFLAATLTLSTILVGCGSSSSDTSDTDETAAAEDTTDTSSDADTSTDESEDSSISSISVRVSDDPLNINPLYVTDLNSFTIMQALYSPFFEIVDGEVYYGNGLLESVESNEDSTVFTLTLKEGLTWHDGEPITADDIVFSMEVLLDEDQAVPYSTYGYDSEGNAAVTEKVDDLTATITFGASNTGFLGSLSQIYCIPEHIYEGVENIGESDLNNEPVGSGPYKFVSYTSGDSYIVEKYDGYFDEVNLDQIVFRVIKDTNSAIAALQSGDIDMISIDASDYATLEDTDGITIYSYNSGQVNAMAMNQENEYLAITEVRQAIAYALDKEELITFAWTSTEYAQPGYSILTPDTLYYNDSLTEYNNDLEQAQALMDEAGVSDITLTLLYSTGADEMENEAVYIQAQLAEIGITVELDPQEDSVYKNTLNEEGGDSYDLVLTEWELGAEPSLYADLVTTGSRSNNSNVADEELDALWEEGLSVADGDERQAIYEEIQEVINDEQYLYVISYSNGFYAMSDEFGGFDDWLIQTIYYDYSKLYAVE